MTMYSEFDLNRFKCEGVDTFRSVFRRDYGRLMHSPAFRRLQGKTQLFPGHESDFFRNRLTHSLEVAQIAKCIAILINSKIKEKFKGQENIEIDLDLIEVAGLAHDIGHPPFGHNGEYALDSKMKQFGGFEGNAQTLRILGKIEKKTCIEDNLNDKYIGFSRDGRDLRVGLNLTFRTLASILKYDSEIPLSRPDESKLEKGYYSSERDLVEKIKSAVNMGDGEFRTIECDIMDIADDIAYSVYDLEDSFKGGFASLMSALLPLYSSNDDIIEKVASKVRKNKTLATVSDDDVRRALDDIFNDFTLGKKPSIDELVRSYSVSNLVSSNGYLRTAFTSKLIKEFVDGIDIKLSDNVEELKKSKIIVRDEVLIKIESLKHFNFETIIMSSMLKNVEYRGKDLVSGIYDSIVDSGGKLLPEDYKMMYDTCSELPEKRRIICDFVAGMTDRYAMEFYSRIKGDGESIFKPL